MQEVAEICNFNGAESNIIENAARCADVYSAF